MKIGIIGAGEVALAIARRAVTAAHAVVIGSRRGPDALRETIAPLGVGVVAASVADAAAADLVILAVPWLDAATVLDGLPAWDDRILVDATNPFIAFDPLQLADLGGRSATTLLAAHAPGARVVKAFNSVTMANFEKGPTQDGARRVLFVSADDAEAKKTVTNLIESLGYAVIDLGDLQEGGRLQQAGGPLAGKDILIAG